MKIISFFVLLACISCRNKPADSDLTSENHRTANGKLFIIGGGDRGEDMMLQLVRESGWKKGDLISAVTLPSGWGDSAYIWLNDDFKKITGENCVKFDSAAVFVPEKIDSLRRSKIIFISGGDQNTMMRLIRGSEVKNAILYAYKNGALIGGTSAGASIMSAKMITGNGLIDTAYESTFGILQRGNLELAEGLSLLDSVIIDQHFITRSRYNRLISAIIENPNYQCIGIDEGTAIIVNGDSARVSGLGQVIEIKLPSPGKLSGDSLLSAKGIQLSIYLPGESFAIKQ